MDIISERFNPKRFFILFAIMFGIDYNYLNSSFAKSIYSPLLSNGMNSAAGEKIRVLPAVISWVIMGLSLELLILYRKDVELKETIVNTMLLAGAIYGVYNLTNLATISWWTPEMAIKDTIWGITLYTITVIIIKHFLQL